MGSPPPRGIPNLPLKDPAPRWCGSTGKVPSGFSFDPSEAGSPTLTCPHSRCCSAAPGRFHPRTCQLRNSPAQKTQEAFSFPNIPRCPFQLSPLMGKNRSLIFLFFFAKATALHFERRKCLCGWMFYVPVTDCSLAAASHRPRRAAAAQPGGAGTGAAPPAGTRLGRARRLAESGPWQLGSKLTFMWVCLDNRKCKNSTWQVIPFKAALRAWQTSNWHRSSEQQIHTT